jgi:hypothetical protein
MMLTRTKKSHPVYRALWLLCFCFLVAFSMNGCNREHGQETDSGKRETEKEHEHFPEHWPTTIDRASERLLQLVENPDAPSPFVTVNNTEEFADLWLWLPLLAADSDLSRHDFSRIDEWSQVWAEQGRESVLGARPMSDLALRPELQQTVRELAMICQTERERIELLQP